VSALFSILANGQYMTRLEGENLAIGSEIEVKLLRGMEDIGF
jgi:hypothetical protein